MQLARAGVESLLWDLKRLPDDEFYVVMNMAFDTHKMFHQDFIEELALAYKSYTSMEDRRQTIQKMSKK
jgi:hypothetical protein